MQKKEDIGKIFSRRSFVIGALQFSVLAVLGTRLAWLQVAQGQRYKTLADKNRINIKMLAPSRGEVLDRFGTKLAVNNQNFRVLVVPEQAGNLEKSLRSLQKLIKLEESDITRVMKQARKLAKFLPLEVKDDLSWEEVSRIEVNLPELPGLSIDVGEIRSYPLGSATAHTVGYVGAVSRADLNGDPVLSLPGFKIGKTAIERHFDKDMRGKAGASELEVNVVGRAVRELNRKDSRTGDNVILTLDAGLQQFVQERLDKERSASAVIMDVHSGAVYALASSPGFDPNFFTRRLSAEMWEGLLSDPGYPLTNKAIAGHYPPGSTFKMVTALAGLKEGAITTNRKVHCPGHFDFGGDRFHCWKTSGHGHQDVVGALAESCDTYFYQIATEIGIEKIAEMARSMGLGEKLAFDLSEERPGLMPDKNWKMGHFGEHWKAGETVVASIGQGYIQTTPLQLAVMTARMVNGGYAVQPWMTEYIGQRAAKDVSWPKMDVDPKHLKLIQRGMDRVLNNKDGTAYKARIEEKRWRMGGKTGTAQVKRITMAQRLAGIRNEDLPWKQRHHALFVGYAPVGDPRYACAVVIEHGGGGSSAAAPLARDIMREAQKRAPAKKPTVKPITLSAQSNVNGPISGPSRKPSVVR